MLVELRVRDLAVIADVTLRLKPGLNVLTGETGAGKSMLVDALALLLGERASGDVVRPGAEKTVIEGAFEFSRGQTERLALALTALGVELDDHSLVIKREVYPEGRSRAWVNGSATTVGVLGQLGALLVDLHGQHETQSLFRADVQRDILDAYSGAVLERAAARDTYTRWRTLDDEEQSLRARQEEVRKKADYLRHVVSEITAANPSVGEDEALAAQSERLGHAEELRNLATELERAVEGAALARATKVLATLTRLDPSVAPWQELLDTAFTNLDELARNARAYGSEIDTDPAALATLETRRDVLARLAAKYGPALPDVLATRDAAARELDLLDSADFDLRELAARREEAAQDCGRAQAALTAKRSSGVARLGKAATELLPELGLPGARFTARLLPRAVPQAVGAEDVSFEVRLNEGLDSRPLARVASGGELSRLMLALKVVLAHHDRVPTLVFDEVDQGIGGEAGAKVGEALARVASDRQALVITHLPQIAAYADHHVVVAKGARAGVATSDVAIVTGEARRREIARMLGDPDMTTALEHAAELLKRASASPETRADTRSRPVRDRPIR
ncbi:MAG TPA: DNA repair protein RecN [Gemmatimonadales bacterium]|nr:DNA repair protein RecN [Gemmatimonadales bacterium]